MRAILVALLIAACGPKPAPLPVPKLPGDGDTNVAKPAPSTKPKAAEDPWAGRTDLIAAPAPKPPARVELPNIENFKLGNGLDVYVIKNGRLPVASVQLAIKAGRYEEPRARLGVSEAAADVIVKGTKKHSAAEIAKKIDFVGGTIAAEATFEATLLSCSVMAKDLPTCLELIPEMVVQPSFPDDEFAKVKQAMIGGVRQRLDDAAALASAHVQNLLWGNEHVRGWIDSEASVNALRRDDLIAWHKEWFVPNNAMLVVSGDVDAKKLHGELERAFGGWAKKAVPPVPQFTEQGLSGIRIRLVDKPGQTQTHIRLAQYGIKHDDPRFWGMLVVNYVLGGGEFSSRLMKVVRVEGGKTYGASSTFDRNMDKGSFVVQTFTRNAEAVATTKLVINEISKMAKEGPSQDEIDGAIANIAGGYGQRFQAMSDLGGALIGAELHGFGVEYLTNYPLAVGGVDLTAAHRAANEILDPRDYVIVMVGDAKDLEPQLKKEGWRYEKVSYTDAITPEPKEPAAPVDAKAIAALHKIVDDALAAKGGKAKLAAVKGFRMTATGTTAAGPQNIPVQIERVYVAPDRMRIDAVLAQQIKVTYAVSGKTGWSYQEAPKQPPQLADMSAQDLATIGFELWREPELIMLKASDPKAKLTPLPDEDVNGAAQHVMKLASPFDDLDLTLYVDKKTKLLTRMQYTEKDAKGRLHTQADDFADYRETSGIKVAYKRTSTTEGRVTSLELGKVEIDPKIDEAQFAKPAPPAKP